MRRVSVPAVTVAPLSARLDVLLQPQEVAPRFDPKLQPLEGVRWQGLGCKRIPVEGEVAMFDVTDPGNLQEW